MTTVAILAFLLSGAYVVAVLEGWLETGRFRPGAPFWHGVALLGRESVVPRQADRLFFEAAPILLLAVTLLAAAVLPLGPDTVIADLATGALFINAALAYVLVAVLMAGWGPNGAYAMVGGWRFLGQLIAYSMLIVMPLTGVAMRAESLLNTAIVQSQAGLWNVLYQPLGFALFFVASLAVCFLPPFDLPTARGELAGGVEAEYAGPRRAVFRLARMILVVTLASASTVFFLGGWLGPGLTPWAWTAIKVFLVIVAMLLAGHKMPRVREADLLAWGWKYGIPLALLNLLIVGVVIVS